MKVGEILSRSDSSQRPSLFATNLRYKIPTESPLTMGVYTLRYILMVFLYCILL